MTRLAENPDVSEQTIRALAGHVGQQVLQRYSHIQRQAKQDAIAALEAQRRKNQIAGGTKVSTVRDRSLDDKSEVTERI